MQAERAFTERLRLCICGDVNLNMTDKSENNDFIWSYMTLNDLLSQVVELVILRATIVGVWKIMVPLKKMIVTSKSPTRLNLQKTHFDRTSPSKPNKLPQERNLYLILFLRYLYESFKMESCINKIL